MKKLSEEEAKLREEEERLKEEEAKRLQEEDRKRREQEEAAQKWKKEELLKQQQLEREKEERGKLTGLFWREVCKYAVFKGSYEPTCKYKMFTPSSLLGQAICSTNPFLLVSYSPPSITFADLMLTAN